MNKSQTVKLIREGRYLAEVEVDVLEDETGWSPYLTLEGVEKLDAVRLALKAGDIPTASRLAKVFKLEAVAA
jgi:hypothetical protein